MKLVDFGLTRGNDELDDEESLNYTPTVATLWYRAPELLLGDTKYTNAVDLWSIGCLHAELLRSKELFPGRSDLHQLCTIFEILGTPTEQTWPGYSQLPVCSSMEFTVHPPQDLRLLFPSASDTEFHLLTRFLLFDPKQRITASEALQHPFFTELPLADKYTPSLSIL
uniref:Protein kinase domain-containing protein n=1 Tax=Arcella intermedia TaxID=1963864 RepID=A0A6B2LN36_9EUKA